MKNLLNHRLGFVEDQVQDTEHYYGHAVCGQCMWFSDEPNEIPHCEFRNWLREQGKEPKHDEGREPEEELFYQSDACNSWFD